MKTILLSYVLQVTAPEDMLVADGAPFADGLRRMLKHNAPPGCTARLTQLIGVDRGRAIKQDASGSAPRADSDLGGDAHSLG